MKTAAAATVLDDDDDLHLKRWVLAATIVAGAHAALVAAYLMFNWATEPAGSAGPPLLIDFAPAAAAPESPADIAPGPEMTQSEEEPPPPEPVEQQKPVEEIPPAPQADVVMQQPEKPVEQKVEKPEPLPRPVERKPVPKPKQQAAPRTSANPVLSQRAAAPSAPSPGAAAASDALPNYRNLIAAHLQRYKQYPGGAGGAQGTAMISFSIDRSGRVLARSLARSSGNSALDAEVMAMISRANPMPPFPAGLPQSQMSFSVPIRFSVR